MHVLPPHVVLPIEVVADLVAGHLTHVWSATESDDPLDPKGCCPVCCAPCHALKWLLDHDWLDTIYAEHISRTGPTFIWDGEKVQVDRKWLNAAWSVRMGCGPHG